LQLGINVTDDSTFGTQVFGTVVLQLPGGRPKQFFRPRKVVDRILDRVERRYRVTTNRTTRTVQVPVDRLMIPAMGAGGGSGTAINNVIVVDPNATTNGTGTFDDPFNTFIGIPDPGSNTLTLVRSGSVQGQYNLAGSSLLLSEAFLNQQIVMMTTPLGTLRFPGLNANATTPVWSNIAGNAPGTSLVNILGDNTEVAGFIFDGRTTTSTANSIIQASNVQGISIHDNTFRNYQTAINLQNITGTIAAGNPASIYSNNFYGSSGQSFNGFLLENNGLGTLDLELGATEYNVAASSGTAVGNFAYGNTGEDANGNGLLDAGEDTNGNFVLDTGAAYSITARNRAVINARVVQNSANAETDVNGDGLLNSEDINNNGILDAGEDTLTVDTDGDGIADAVNGVLDFGDDLNHNGRFDTGSGTGFVVNAGATQSTINLAMRGNIADRNIGDGVFLAANSSVLNADQLGEDVNGNGILDGFEDLNGNGILDLTEDTNGNGVLDGFEDVNGNGILDPTEDTNGNGVLDLTEDVNGDGILESGEDTNGNGVLDLSEDRNGNGMLDLSEDTNGNNRLDRGEDGNEDINGNGVLDTGEDLNGDGFLNLGNGDGRLTGGFIIVGNQITRNGRDGIRVESTNNSNVDLRLIGNTIGSQANRATGNKGIGLNINADSGSMDLNLGFLYFEDVNLNMVLDPGEDTNNNGTLDAPLVSSGNQIIANAGGGVNFGLTGTAIGQLNAIGNSIQGTGGGSLGFAIGGGVDTATVPFDFVNTSVVGVDITQIVWNLAPSAAQVDSVNMPFSIVNSSDVTTGLQTVNGSTTFSVPNLATAVDLVFNDFNPINNMLDANEVDANMDGIPDQDLPETFSFNLDIDLASGTDPVFATDLFNSRVNVTYSTGQMVTGLLQADPNNAANAIFVPDATTLPQSTGFAISTAGNSVLLPSRILANEITNFGGDGVSVLSTDEGNVQNLLVRANTITGNFGVGANFQTNSTLNAQLTASVINNNFTGSTLGGINATATGGTLTLNDIQGNSLDGGGSGIRLVGTQAGSLSARITSNAINNSMIMNGSTGNGVEVVADNATVTLLELANNTINTNAGTGVTLRAINSGSLIVPASEDLNGNGVLDPGEDVNEDLNLNGILDAGEDLNTDGRLNVGNGNGRLDRGITTNSINNNAGDSFSVTATAASSSTPSTVSLGNVRNNQILFNTAGTGGFAVNGVNSNITGSFTGNIVTGNPATNPTAGPGFLSSTSGGIFDLVVGGPDAADGNTISQVQGAGIAFVMTEMGTGSFLIQNNQISSVVDDNDIQTTRAGDGISISLEGLPTPGLATATLTRSEISDNVIGDATNTTLGVAGSGIWVNTAENTRIQDLLVSGNMIGNAGNDNAAVAMVPPSFITDAGIRFDRSGDSRYDVVDPRPGDLRSVTIDGNTVVNSGSVNAGSAVSGLQINVMNGLRDDIDFDIRNNIFSGNTGEGVELNTQADASLATDLTNNLIENNTFNGISVEGVEIDTANDLETQGGTWTQNIIRNNGFNGISIGGVTGDVIPLIIGQNGNNPFTGQSLGNMIVDNRLSGISIIGGGFVQINNNQIARNGEQGIDIEADGIGIRTALIQNNSITSNAGTGIELLNGSSDLLIAVALGNTIDGNLGRGVDVLNRSSGEADIQFGDGTALGANTITGNGFEGFYVVNTASAVQAQGSPSLAGGVSSSTALDATGAVDAQPDMVLDLNRNIISANNNMNSAATFPGGGFSLRVGTSGSSTGLAGATDVADTTGDANGDGSGRGEIVGVGANSALFGNGRVNARVINNTFEGNLGDDVFMESFVSTVAPLTGGTWTATVFAPAANYQTDPLARLNLVFNGNVGNSLHVMNPAATYTDADPVFKSRLNTQTPPGPFTTPRQNSTGRNAQRTQARTNNLGFSLPPNTGPDAGTYQYPGQGVSTFRLENNFDISGFQSADGFVIDGGIFSVGAAWGLAAPGTFQFDDAFLGVAP
ncbi:MAG: right-handed parallel beta-helix repeat-containing protein, partial [Rhodopirellula sp.]|nr:right-handed parallel beta-helix repeat-containing protein [Rhodopirellula sp.]